MDARKLGVLVDRIHRELTDEEIARIAGTYHAWRGEKVAGAYADVAGFCKSATTEEIAQHGFVLTPGRYVGAEALEEDDEEFGEKLRRLRDKLAEEFSQSASIESEIKKQLARLLPS